MSKDDTGTSFWSTCWSTLYVVTHWSVSHRCPNLLSLTLAGCGHLTDQDVISMLQSCRKLRCLHLENCVRITDGSLRGVVAHGDSLQEVKVDFCRNITVAGLQAVREKRPSIQLSAERSAYMIPDREPEGTVPLRIALQKLLSWGRHSSSFLMNYKELPNKAFVTIFVCNRVFIQVLSVFLSRFHPNNWEKGRSNNLTNVPSALQTCKMYLFVLLILNV